MNAISRQAVTDVDKYLQSTGLEHMYLKDMSGSAKHKLADYLITIEARRFNKMKAIQELPVPEIIGIFADKGVKVQVKQV